MTVKIEGRVWTKDNSLTEQEFNEQFINFCELKGWLFVGVTKDMEEPVPLHKIRG